MIIKKIELKKNYIPLNQKNWINENDILINNLGYNFLDSFFIKISLKKFLEFYLKEIK